MLTNLDEVETYLGEVLNELVTYSVTFLHPTTLFLVGAGNLLMNPDINQGDLLTMKLIPFLNMVHMISFLGSKKRYHPTYLVLSLTFQVT
jgi:hypothetical protein